MANFDRNLSFMEACVDMPSHHYVSWTIASTLALQVKLLPSARACGEGDAAEVQVPGSATKTMVAGAVVFKDVKIAAKAAGLYEVLMHLISYKVTAAHCVMTK